LGLLLAWHLARPLLAERGRVAVRYLDGPRITVPRGISLLDASRSAGVPHAAVCGGRGRCSTCRVRLLEGAAAVPPPGEGESRVLRRIGAAADVRLACQLPVTAPLTVLRLMPPAAGTEQVLRPLASGQGQEREIVVLFADLRGFTRLAESRLPYDTVFILNRYFRLMGEAITEAGGHLDKFIGDGIMALFGLEEEPREAARRALAAAVGMAEALARLNRELGETLAEPLRMGIGIHAGPAIVGEMGYGRATGLTAVGDTVNVASRLEAATKEHGVGLLVSVEAFRRAELGSPPEGAQRVELNLRGRDRPLAALAIVELSGLAAAVRRAAPPRAGRRRWFLRERDGEGRAR
ncbi:MAG TPA: adenylate/guanylate cyclase domain-containing protein, partial [Rhodospirillales bacterium]|nr:adenylate/guanylate cyclase domain-containing protein [Rhodospirillales bacterium]